MASSFGLRFPLYFHSISFPLRPTICAYTLSVPRINRNEMSSIPKPVWPPSRLQLSLGEVIANNGDDRSALTMPALVSTPWTS